MRPLISADLWRWIEENRTSFEPPVGNKVIWEDSQFTAMVIRGPNRRRDFHDDPSDEIFYMLRGTMTLEYIDEEGKRQNVVIREGEMLLVPAHTPHSPHRPADTWGRDGHRARPARGHRGVRREPGHEDVPPVRPRAGRARAADRSRHVPRLRRRPS